MNSTILGKASLLFSQFGKTVIISMKGPGAGATSQSSSPKF